MNNNLSMVVIGGLVQGVIFRSYPQRTLFSCDTLPPIHPGAIFWPSWCIVRKSVLIMNMDEIMLTFLKYNDSNNERKKTANKANKQNKQTIQIISFLSIICFVQIIESSHKCGRLDHVLTYGQLAVTDPSRVDKIMERFPMKYCLLNPGMIYMYILLCRWSVVFFCIYGKPST